MLDDKVTSARMVVKTDISKWRFTMRFLREVFWGGKKEPEVGEDVQKQLSEAHIALDVAETLKFNNRENNIRILQRVVELLLLPTYSAASANRDSFELYVGGDGKLHKVPSETK